MNKSKTLYAVLLSTLVLSAGCSKTDNPGSESGDPLLIRLGAGITATSKAPVVETTEFTAAVAGWETSETVNYGTTKTWAAKASVKANTSAQTITLDPPRQYNQNKAIKTYMKAWYPQGTLGDNGVVTYKSTDTGFAGDGTDDVLLAGEVVGAADNAGTKTLAFTHKLTQLKFTVKGDAAFAATNTKIESIKVNGMQLPNGIDLTTDAVTYAGAAQVTVPDITSSQTITASAVAAGNPIMVMPFTTSGLTIDVKTSAITYTGVQVTINGDATTIAGKAYTIELSFAAIGIAAQATVANWDDTGSGSGNVTQ